jgi:hypothetical protein
VTPAGEQPSAASPTCIRAITERTAAGLPGHRAVEWLRALSESVQIADVPKEKADLMHAIYERITVAGPIITSARLTPSAYLKLLWRARQVLGAR